MSIAHAVVALIIDLLKLCVTERPDLVKYCIVVNCFVF